MPVKNYNKFQLSKSLLFELYINQEKSTVQIGNILDCSYQTVRRWLNKFDIQIRTINKIFSEEHKKKISIANKGQKLKEIHKFDCKCSFCRNKLGLENPFFGKKHSEETKSRLSLSHGGTGIPYQDRDYPKEFIYIRKEVIKRDNYQCQNCGMTEEEHLIVYGEDIHAHHIDYNKKNNEEINLITLCKACNNRANYNKSYWLSKYKEQIKCPKSQI